MNNTTAEFVLVSSDCNWSPAPLCWTLCSTALTWTQLGEENKNHSAVIEVQMGGRGLSQLLQPQCDCSEFGLQLRELRRGVHSPPPSAEGEPPSNQTAFYDLVMVVDPRKLGALRHEPIRQPVLLINYMLNQQPPAAAAIPSNTTTTTNRTVSCAAYYCLASGTATVLGQSAQRLHCMQEDVAPEDGVVLVVIMLVFMAIIMCCVCFKEHRSDTQAQRQVPPDPAVPVAP